MSTQEQSLSWAPGHGHDHAGGGGPQLLTKWWPRDHSVRPREAELANTRPGNQQFSRGFLRLATCTRSQALLVGGLSFVSFLYPLTRDLTLLLCGIALVFIRFLFIFLSHWTSREESPGRSCRHHLAPSRTPGTWPSGKPPDSSHMGA